MAQLNEITELGSKFLWAECLWAGRRLEPISEYVLEMDENSILHIKG